MLNQRHKSADTTTDTIHVSRILELTRATFAGRITADCLNRLEKVYFKWIQIKSFVVSK